MLRRAVPSIVLSGLLLFTAGCDDETTRPIVPGGVEFVSTVESAVVGETVPVSARVLTTSGQTVPGAEVTFSIADEAGAAIDEQVVAADNAGIAQADLTVGEVAGSRVVTARVAGIDQAATLQFAAEAGTAAELITETRSINIPTLGATAQLEIEARDEFDNLVTDPDLTFAVEDPQVVSVSAEGVVTALEDGVTNVTVGVADAPGVTVVIEIRTGAQVVPLRGAFILSNEENDNDVIFFPLTEDGTLGEARRFDTGGEGTGKSIIGAAHPLEFTNDRRFLLAVNAGSDELSAFAVTEEGLQLTDIVPSGGKKPISVTIRDDGVVFVLNLNGGEGGIAGFRLSDSGDLTPIPGSGRQLGEDIQDKPPALPAQVEFSPDGNVLVVTERFSGPNNEGRILTFTVGSDGLLSDPIVHPPFGRTPFGMDFTESGVLLVTEAFAEAPGNPIPNEGKLSSFRVSENGALEVISRSVPALGSVTCWVETKGDFAFATNTASNNITTFRVLPDGSLERLRLTPTGKGPIGIELSVDSNFLFNLNAGEGTITVFRVNESTGELTQIGKVNSANPAFGLKAL